MGGDEFTQDDMSNIVLGRRETTTIAEVSATELRLSDPQII
jgi:hypothetical protein